MFELPSKLKSRYTNMPSRFVLLLKGDLFKAPIKNPQKVLDLGTGTGIWAIEFAEYIHPFVKILYISFSVNLIADDIPKLR